MHEEGLEGVASGGVAGLGVDNGSDSLGLVRGSSEVGGANAIRMTQHRDLGRALDIPDKLITTPGDNKINVAILGKEGSNDIPSSDELDGGIGDVSLLEGSRDDAGDGLERLGGLLSALEDGGVAGLDGQGGDVGDDLGTGLEDDEQDADGA